jgi:hypothetical protein
MQAAAFFACAVILLSQLFPVLANATQGQEGDEGTPAKEEQKVQVTVPVVMFASYDGGDLIVTVKKDNFNGTINVMNHGDLHYTTNKSPWTIRVTRTSWTQIEGTGWNPPTDDMSVQLRANPDINGWTTIPRVGNVLWVTRNTEGTGSIDGIDYQVKSSEGDRPDKGKYRCTVTFIIGTN